MIRMKLSADHTKPNRRSQVKRLTERYDVSSLRGSSVDDNRELTAKGLFRGRVAESLKQAWRADAPADEKWTLLKTTLCDAAELTLGREIKRNPDWFTESKDDLDPLFRKRNEAHLQWLNTGKERDKKEFRKARGEARRATRRAKNSWFQKKAQEAQDGKSGGKVVWRCIRDIQRGRRGLHA